MCRERNVNFQPLQKQKYLRVLDIVRPSFKQTINQQLKANSTVFFCCFFLQINVEKIKDWHFNWQKSFIFNKTMLLLCCFLFLFFISGFFILFFSIQQIKPIIKKARVSRNTRGKKYRIQGWCRVQKKNKKNKLESWIVRINNETAEMISRELIDEINFFARLISIYKLRRRIQN